MQSAQIHPLKAAGFDKTILLITKLITTLMITRHGEPDYDEKHSAEAPIFRAFAGPTKRMQSVKLFAA